MPLGCRSCWMTLVVLKVEGVQESDDHLAVGITPAFRLLWGARIEPSLIKPGSHVVDVDDRVARSRQASRKQECPPEIVEWPPFRVELLDLLADVFLVTNIPSEGGRHVVLEEGAAVSQVRSFVPKESSPLLNRVSSPCPDTTRHVCHGEPPDGITAIKCLASHQNVWIRHAPVNLRRFSLLGIHKPDFCASDRVTQPTEELFKGLQ